MKYIILTQLLIFTSYILYVIIGWGVQKSISESWYVVKQEYLFTWMCMLIGVLHFAHIPQHPLFFLSGSALAFVGVASEFKDKGMTKIVHYAGAGIAIASSILALFSLGIWWILVLNVISMATFSLFKPKNYVWWLEIIAFYSIFGALIQYYYIK